MMMPTALLICMENTFWNISSLRDGPGNFVELFKKSFKLYVESGARKATEADVNLLRIQSGCPLALPMTSWNVSDSESDEFKAKLCKIIIEHCLRKFHYCFYLHLTHLNTFFA